VKTGAVKLEERSRPRRLKRYKKGRWGVGREKGRRKGGGGITEYGPVLNYEAHQRPLLAGRDRIPISVIPSLLAPSHSRIHSDTFNPQ